MPLRIMRRRKLLHDTERAVYFYNNDILQHNHFCRWDYFDYWLGAAVTKNYKSSRQDAYKTTIKEQERASILSAIAAAQWRDRREGFLRDKADSVLLMQYNLGRGMSRSTAENIWGRDFVRMAIGE